ncbi:MAG: hypothetical protein Kow0089_06320 [Desulfobulbaceae bacterium]
MKRTSRKTSLGATVLLAAALFFGVQTVHGVDLAAVEGQWLPPDSAVPITMWGFIPDPGSCPAGPVAWDLGPAQNGVAGGSLSITLRNCLSEPVSLVIPGQHATLTPQTTTDGQGRQRVTSFTAEAAPGGGTATYTWTNLKRGTFLYQSGSHPAKQMHMGLYGVLKVGQYFGAYSESLVVFSEIDPVLHATQAAATPLTYKPRYFLVNGQAYLPGQPPPVLAGARMTKNHLLRLVNAGLMSHTPVIQGPYMKLVAEDGNPYPYKREQYSVMLAPGKTIDALWYPDATGDFALYDRSLSLSTNGAVGGGLLVYVNVDVAPPRFPWEMFIPAITGMGKLP